MLVTLNLIDPCPGNICSMASVYVGGRLQLELNVRQSANG